MKKLIILSALMVSALAIQAQNNTITHYGTFVTINWDHGDTISVPTGPGTQVYPTKNNTNVKHPDGSTYKLDPDDFSSYSTNHALWLTLAQMVYGNFTFLYSFDGSGQMDTTFCLIGTDTVCYRLGNGIIKYGAAQPW